MVIVVIQFNFLSINTVWALLGAHLKAGLTARAKTRLSRVQNVFMPANIYINYVKLN